MIRDVLLNELLFFRTDHQFPVCERRTMWFLAIKSCIHRFVIKSFIGEPRPLVNFWYGKLVTASSSIIWAWNFNNSNSNFTPTDRRSSNSASKALENACAHADLFAPIPSIYFKLKRALDPCDETHIYRTSFPSDFCFIVSARRRHHRLVFCSRNLRFPRKYDGNLFTHFEIINLSPWSMSQ